MLATDLSTHNASSTRWETHGNPRTRQPLGVHSVWVTLPNNPWWQEWFHTGRPLHSQAKPLQFQRAEKRRTKLSLTPGWKPTQVCHNRIDLLGTEASPLHKSEALLNSAEPGCLWVQWWAELFPVGLTHNHTLIPWDILASTLSSEMVNPWPITSHADVTQMRPAIAHTAAPCTGEKVWVWGDLRLWVQACALLSSRLCGVCLSLYINKGSPVVSKEEIKTACGKRCQPWWPWTPYATLGFLAATVLLFVNGLC